MRLLFILFAGIFLTAGCVQMPENQKTVDLTVQFSLFPLNKAQEAGREAPANTYQISIDGNIVFDKKVLRPDVDPNFKGKITALPFPTEVFKVSKGKPVTINFYFKEKGLASTIVDVFEKDSLIKVGLDSGGKELKLVLFYNEATIYDGFYYSPTPKRYVWD